MPRFLTLIILLVVLLLPAIATAAPLAKERVPEPLQPWVNWVLPDKPEPVCPIFYTNPEQKFCAWPTAIQLNLAANQGRFTGDWLVFADTWATLPGDQTHWPQNVKINGQPALVLARDDAPSVKLLAGSSAPTRYQISGDFFWDNLPDHLPILTDTGLLALTLNGQPVAAPALRDGGLWLNDDIGGAGKIANVANSLAMKVYRLIDDGVPLKVTTLVQLDVSGEQRELRLPKPLLPGFVPISLTSELPVKLESDGSLRVQLRPGHWQVHLEARNDQNPGQLDFQAIADGAPDEEIWSFNDDSRLRIVELQGLSAVDPSQTEVPDQWRNLPAYRVEPGQKLVLKTIRRGDPEPDANKLTLQRQFWLDFDGGGYTVNDTITGTLNRDWRLNVLPEMQLGRVAVLSAPSVYQRMAEPPSDDASGLLITRQPGQNALGVEVRQALTGLSADSRIAGNIGSVSAVGWAQDFQSVSAELNLPPGWRLLAASGVDNLPDSVLSRWTLLDLFLVLCAGLAVARLCSRAWGVFALATLALVWHEPDAPRWVWLNLIAVTALLEALPGDKFPAFRRYAQAYRALASIMLVLTVLPFMVSQVRSGLYPQLEPHHAAAPLPGLAAGQVALVKAKPVMSPPASAMLQDAPEPSGEALKEEQQAAVSNYLDRAFPKSMSKGDSAESSATAQPLVERTDPNAKIQTGPGLPDWQWQKIHLSWNGAVSNQQRLQLWYLSPLLNTLLNLLRTVAVAVLAWWLLRRWPVIWPLAHVIAPVLLAGVLWPALLLLPGGPAWADYPSEALLNELKARLLQTEAPDCLPSCAEIPQMKMSLTATQVAIDLEIHAHADVAVPLPGVYGQWLPQQVTVDNVPATALLRQGEGLTLRLPRGVHTVHLSGAAPRLGQFSLPLPLKPKLLRLDKSGWDVVGLQKDGVPDPQLQFLRTGQGANAESGAKLEPGNLPPFIQVQRHLQLGLDWRVHTVVARLSATDAAIALNIPLLPGEAVSTEGIHVKDGQVEINMAAQDKELAWDSTLAKTPELQLAAPQAPWTEVWQAEVSPIWHLAFHGLASMHREDTLQWLPEWHPWPGETLTLQLTRPEAVVGQTLTIDQSQLTVTPGQRLRDVTLDLRLRSSQGGQHSLTLPEKADLQSVTLDGRSVPLRLQQQQLTIPIHPGVQMLTVHWQTPQPLGVVLHTPEVHVGLPSVNTRLTMNLAADRWLLVAFGPRLGPAVLFWGVLVVIALVAFGLGHIPLTPLKTGQWFLLLVGLSQVPLLAAASVVAWLLLLGWRQTRSTDAQFFNGLQVFLALLTVLALGVLCAAVAQGLLDAPDMRIVGNQSTAQTLQWYQDRSGETLASATVVAVPMWVYRLLMLAWSLWLAAALLNWLRWGWGCYSQHGIWRKPRMETPTLSGDAQD